MKAKDLAKWLLKEPELEVLIFDDDNNLVDMNTISLIDKGDESLFDKNDDKGIFTISGDCIENSKFKNSVFILSNQKNYKSDH